MQNLAISTCLRARQKLNLNEIVTIIIFVYIQCLFNITPRIDTRDCLHPRTGSKNGYRIVGTDPEGMFTTHRRCIIREVINCVDFIFSFPFLK